MLTVGAGLTRLFVLPTSYIVSGKLTFIPSQPLPAKAIFYLPFPLAERGSFILGDLTDIILFDETLADKPCVYSHLLTYVHLITEPPL